MLNSQIAELGTRPFSDEMVISKMLSNLPAAYDTFQTMWKTVATEQQTLVNLQAWLLDEERSIRKRQSENHHHQTSAFFSRSSQGPAYSGRLYSQSSTNGGMSSSASGHFRSPRPYSPHEQQDPSQRA